MEVEVGDRQAENQIGIAQPDVPPPQKAGGGGGPDARLRRSGAPRGEASSNSGAVARCARLELPAFNLR